VNLFLPKDRLEVKVHSATAMMAIHYMSVELLLTDKTQLESGVSSRPQKVRKSASWVLRLK
jgi:hypothetical protein